MKRINLCGLIFFLFSITFYAQDIKRYEGEAYLGLTSPLGNYHQGKAIVGPELGLEIRCNLPYSKWDYGILANVSTSVYELDGDTLSEWYWEQSNRSINIMSVCDYNFRQESKFNPYIGLGVGISLYDTINEVVYDESGVAAVFRPRIGIELFRHLRIGAYANIIKHGFNNIGVKISGVIGWTNKNSLPNI